MSSRVTSSPDPDPSNDPFFDSIENNLIKPLGLLEGVISVKRYQKQNGRIEVKLSSHDVQNPNQDATEPLTVKPENSLPHLELTAKIKSILEVLLKDCIIPFGNLNLELRKGLLQKVDFTNSKIRGESTAEFFHRTNPA